jgi:hypothetical protein
VVKIKTTLQEQDAEDEDGKIWQPALCSSIVWTCC